VLRQDYRQSGRTPEMPEKPGLSVTSSGRGDEPASYRTRLPSTPGKPTETAMSSEPIS
jgi:hypothetical protein